MSKKDGRLESFEEWGEAQFGPEPFSGVTTGRLIKERDDADSAAAWARRRLAERSAWEDTRANARLAWYAALDLRGGPRKTPAAPSKRSPKRR